MTVFYWILLGGVLMSAIALIGSVTLMFLVFFALEQLLHWHHCHNAAAQCRKPLTYLILIGDGLHNFLDGLSNTFCSGKFPVYRFLGPHSGSQQAC